MLGGQHASHLCHQPTCINPDHIVVETKEKNEGRKACKKAGSIIITEWKGEELVLPPNNDCRCEPPCIYMIERRVAAQRA
jgi:hypothetical protein